MNPQEDGSIILKKYEPNFSKRIENLRQELKEYQIEETNSFDTNLDSLLEEVLKQLNKMEAWIMSPEIVKALLLLVKLCAN